MSPLEIALIVLIAIWSIIFIIIAVALVIFILTIKKALNKASNILDKTEAVANKVDLPSKVVIASIVGFIAKNSLGPIIRLVSGFLTRKKS